jgi:hypothetical protein
MSTDALFHTLASADIARFIESADRAESSAPEARTGRRSNRRARGRVTGFAR